MATRKSKKLDTFEGLYKRLEEVILANSGENEFEEIFKLVVLKLWNELNDEPVELTMDKANLKLRKIDLLWGGVLSEPRLLLCEEHYQICVSILKTFSFKIRYKTDNLEEKLLVSEHQDLIHQAESYLILAHKLQFCNGIRSDHSYNIRISFKSGTLFFEIVGNNHV